MDVQITNMWVVQIFAASFIKNWDNSTIYGQTDVNCKEKCVLEEAAAHEAAADKNTNDILPGITQPMRCAKSLSSAFLQQAMNSL